MAALAKQTRRVYRAPLVKLKELVEGMTTAERQEVARELHSLSAHCALLATYVNHRDLGRDHEESAKYANSTRRIVRRRFGYHTTPDINF